MEEVKKPKRGFAAMDPKKVAEIASKGGKAAHAAGTAHQFSSDEARKAGKLGGVAPHKKRGRGRGSMTSLEHELDELERTNPEVKAAKDNLEKVKQEIIQS